MAARSLSLQDHFLNSVRRAKLPVTIFLVKGVKLQGVDHLVRHFLAAAAPRGRVAAGLQAFDLDDHAGASRRRTSSPTPADGRTAPRPRCRTCSSPRPRAKRADDHVPGQRRHAPGRGRRLRPILRCCSSAAGRSSWSTSTPSRRFSRRIRSNLEPSGERRARRSDLNVFDGNGAIEVARGERAVIVVPELPREGARAIGRGAARGGGRASPRRSASRSSAGRAFRVRTRPAGDPARQGPGRGDRRARRGARTPSC